MAKPLVDAYVCHAEFHHSTLLRYIVRGNTRLWLFIASLLCRPRTSLARGEREVMRRLEIRPALPVVARWASEYPAMFVISHELITCADAESKNEQIRHEQLRLLNG